LKGHGLKPRRQTTSSVQIRNCLEIGTPTPEETTS
jgi:hypothetical protein